MRTITCANWVNGRFRIRWKDDSQQKFNEEIVLNGGESGAAAKCMDIAIAARKYTIIAPESVLKFIPENLRSKA